jgi:uncharacterized protein YdhG (YjbR/CyaY superfamily)
MPAQHVLTTGVDDYIARFPEDVQQRLHRLRGLILRTAPKSEECIRYGMPAYRLHGPLVYFAAYPHHIGLYALPSAQKAFQQELAGYKTGKGSVQFPHDRPLPMALIRSILRFRINENEAREKTRKKSGL